jgi:transketolase
VKIIGGYAGLSNGKDGATHQSLEDVAIMRSFANLVVMSPSDAVLTRKMVRAAVQHAGPVYLRVEYENVPCVHAETTEFVIGRGYRLREGSDVTVAAYGLAVHRVLAAADAAALEGISTEVLEFPTLKPLDTDLLRASVQKTGRLITVEDHSVIGGLGSAASDTLLTAGVVTRFHALGIRDVYTESGPSDSVREKYGVGRQNIIDAIRALVGQQ